MKKEKSRLLASNCVTSLFLHSSLQVEIQPISNSGFSVGLLVVSSNNQTLAVLNQTGIYGKAMRKLTEWK